MQRYREADSAKAIIVHYIRLACEKSGVQWDSDNEFEIRDALDSLIETAVRAATGMAGAGGCRCCPEAGGGGGMMETQTKVVDTGLGLAVHNCANCQDVSKARRIAGPADAAPHVYLCQRKGPGKVVSGQHCCSQWRESKR